MSLIIACKDEHGIILATDSKAIDFDLSGKMVELKIQRLHQLTAQTAIIVGGSAEGEKMCQSLRDFVAKEKLEDIEDVYSAALPFLASEYERFMRKACEFLPIDPIHQVYFILGGYSQKKNKDPLQLYLLWTKKKLPQLDGDEISSAFTVPRSIRLEYQLNQLCRQNNTVEEILNEMRRYLKDQSQINEEISGPFCYAVITRDGFKIIE